MLNDFEVNIGDYSKSFSFDFIVFLIAGFLIFGLIFSFLHVKGVGQDNQKQEETEGNYSELTCKLVQWKTNHTYQYNKSSKTCEKKTKSVNLK